MRRSLFIAPALLAVALLAGCGQTNTQGTAKPPPGGQEAMTRQQPPGTDKPAEGEKKDEKKDEKK